MIINPLYQSNYFWCLISHQSESFIGKSRNKLITVTIDSFSNINNIELSDKLDKITFNKFSILEALDYAKLKLYQTLIKDLDAEQVRNKIQFEIERLHNREFTYIQEFIEQRYLEANSEVQKQIHLLINWYSIYNSKYENIDIIEFVFYLNSMSHDRLSYCMQHYQEKPEIFYD